jgi:hypothetical protein
MDFPLFEMHSGFWFMFHKKQQGCYYGKVHFDEDVKHNYMHVCFKKNISHSQCQAHFDENINHDQVLKGT